MLWDKDGEAGIAVAMSMQPDDVPRNRSSQDATRILQNALIAVVVCNGVNGYDFFSVMFLQIRISIEQSCTDITLGRVGQYNDDQLVCIFFPPGNLDCRGRSRTG